MVQSILQEYHTMKILLINYELPPIGGGAGNATFQIARALVKIGHEPTILTAAFKARSSIAMVDGIRIHPIPTLRKKPDQSNLFEMASFVFSALARSPGIAQNLGIEATIVFFTLPCGPIALKLKKINAIPYVISMQGGDVPRLVPSLDLLHLVLTPFRRRILRESTASVANSYGLKQLSEKTDPIDIKVIPNGIDSTFFTPAQIKIDDRSGPFTILFAGRFHEQKNIPALLQAARYLISSLQRNVIVHLVGDGPQKDKLITMANKSGIADKIQWYGWQDKERLRDLYRSADCFVNPSFYEGMPNTVLEAMACGLPVIASDVIGNQELVVNEKTGYLFPIREETILVERLRALVDDRMLAARLGQNGRKRAVDCFSWERTAQGYIDFF
jgi:glycosyltransferase involved in cell wall biosynthesis